MARRDWSPYIVHMVGNEAETARLCRTYEEAIEEATLDATEYAGETYEVVDQEGETPQVVATVQVRDGQPHIEARP